MATPPTQFESGTASTHEARVAGVVRTLDDSIARRPCRDASSPQRRVLMICCAFPPTGGPGVQRSAKFAKYLPSAGWLPQVWAADQMPGLPRDTSLLVDLPPEVHVHRLRVRDPRARLREHRDSAGISRFAWMGERIWTRLLHHAVPDPMAFWALRSFRACRRLIDEQDIDAVYSTYSPASNHLLAWALHGATGLPWVADFRDLWTDDYGYPYGRGLRRRIDRTLERAFVRSADAVLAVTDGQRDVLCRHDPKHPDKFITITNGFDPADFTSVDRDVARARLHGPEEKFVLTFTGWFLSDRVSPGLIEALTRMGAWARQQRIEFTLRIVGRVSEDMTRRLRAAGVDVETPGYLRHDQAVAHQLAADALLLLIPEGPNGATLLTGKIFEYLASRTPILLVSPSQNCEAARLLRRCRTGTIASSNADAIFEALCTLWMQWKYGGLPPSCADEALETISRETLAHRLGDVLNRVSVRCPR